ncbi:hypothetical protein [Rouxiella badensis]|uniref:hypothetical protein n=1 Tax=Rouxiella badensis TaxID=1646377 RepID=UPI00301C61F5
MTSAIAGMESRSIDLINKIKNNPSTRNIKNFIKNVTAIKNNFGHLFGVIKIKNNFVNHSKTYSDLLELRHLQVNFSERKIAMINKQIANSLNNTIQSPYNLRINEKIIMKNGNEKINKIFYRIYNSNDFNKLSLYDEREKYMAANNFIMKQELGKLTVEPIISAFKKIQTLTQPFSREVKKKAGIAIAKSVEKKYSIDETIAEIKKTLFPRQANIQFIANRPDAGFSHPDYPPVSDEICGFFDITQRLPQVNAKTSAILSENSLKSIKQKIEELSFKKFVEDHPTHAEKTRHADNYSYEEKEYRQFHEKIASESEESGYAHSDDEYIYDKIDDYQIDALTYETNPQQPKALNGASAIVNYQKLLADADAKIEKIKRDIFKINKADTQSLSNPLDAQIDQLNTAKNRLSQLARLKRQAPLPPIIDIGFNDPSATSRHA